MSCREKSAVQNGKWVKLSQPSANAAGMLVTAANRTRSMVIITCRHLDWPGVKHNSCNQGIRLKREAGPKRADRERRPEPPELPSQRPHSHHCPKSPRLSCAKKKAYCEHQGRASDFGTYLSALQQQHVSTLTVIGVNAEATWVIGTGAMGHAITSLAD